jgi:hypothetical protein
MGTRAWKHWLLASILAGAMWAASSRAAENARARTFKDVLTLKGHSGPVWSAALSPEREPE